VRSPRAASSGHPLAAGRGLEGGAAGRSLARRGAWRPEAGRGALGGSARPAHAATAQDCARSAAHLGKRDAGAEPAAGAPSSRVWEVPGTAAGAPFLLARRPGRPARGPAVAGGGPAVGRGGAGGAWSRTGRGRAGGGARAAQGTRGLGRPSAPLKAPPARAPACPCLPIRSPPLHAAPPPPATSRERRPGDPACACLLSSADVVRGLGYWSARSQWLLWGHQAGL
jgi:hypothetical protein